LELASVLKKWRVEIVHGTTTDKLVVQARNQDEAMEQALLILNLNYQTVESVTAEEAERER
jgi:hypothetical protein